MPSIPHVALPLMEQFAAAFTDPTYKRFVVLLFAAILCTGRRTVSNLLRTVAGLAPGHPSSYRRVLSASRWLAWRLARALAVTILNAFLPNGVVLLAGDDTAEQHRGAKVYGKGKHRDAVHSSNTFMAYLWGHKWVVLAILVDLPFTHRRWALPVLVALYHSPDWNKQHGRRHKTPAELMRQLLAVLIHWFPERKFVFAGDGGYGTHPLARFAHRHRRHLTLISRFYPDAALYAAPPQRQKKQAGRPRVKGRKLPTPSEVVAKRKRRRILKKVAWYGGTERRVAVVTGTGNWYKSGHGIVPVRWVFVHDLTGTHRDEYFFTTDQTLSSLEIVEMFTGRWNIETTFQEIREYLGFGTTRGWCRKTVLRASPCLFGLYSVIALLYARLPVPCTREVRIQWEGKGDSVTFSEATTAVRRWLWVKWVFANHAQTSAFQKLPARLQRTVLSGLAPAA